MCSNHNDVIKLTVMTRKGANKRFLKDFKFLSTCSNARKRKIYLSKCKNFDGLIGNIQHMCGKLSLGAKTFANPRAKKILKKHKALKKIHRNKNLARQHTLTGDNFLKDAFKFIVKNPEVLEIPLELL